MSQARLASSVAALQQYRTELLDASTAALDELASTATTLLHERDETLATVAAMRRAAREESSQERDDLMT